jgi:formiminotetrahydrofolate cyclodeaminase
MSSTAAQVPVASAQNLFGKAFTALEQLLGLTPPAASSAAAAPKTDSAAASAATVNPKINLMA